MNDALARVGREERPKAAAAAIRMALERPELATKDDLAAATAALRADLAALETRLTWRMLAIVGGLLALVTALDRLLA